jgi:hypothetical protein
MRRNRKQIASKLIAFFEHISPVYPIVDEQAFRTHFQSDRSSESSKDIAWTAIIRLVICTGANSRASKDSETKELCRGLLSQTISSTHKLCLHMSLSSVQVFALLVSVPCQVSKAN